MQLAHRWLDRNLTRLERALALIIILLVLGTFTRHILLVFARAEMSMVSATIINLNSSLKYYAALAVMRGDYAQLSRMDGMNPVDEVQLLQDNLVENNEQVELISETSTFPTFNKPRNYIGELKRPDPDMIAKGEWYFDTDTRTLNYRVINAEYFSGEMQSNNIISFKVNIEYVDSDGNGRYNPQTDKFVSINVENITAYDG